MFLSTFILSVFGYIFLEYKILIEVLIILISLWFYRIYICKEHKVAYRTNIYLTFMFSFLFWIFHFWNYSEIDTKLIIATVPIFFSGLILSYIRLKFNLLMAMLIHMLHNLIVYLIFIY